MSLGLIVSSAAKVHGAVRNPFLTVMLSKKLTWEKIPDGATGE